jgi:hypothetical protein
MKEDAINILVFILLDSLNASNHLQNGSRIGLAKATHSGFKKNQWPIKLECLRAFSFLLQSDYCKKHHYSCEQLIILVSQEKIRELSCSATNTKALERMESKHSKAYFF